MSEVEHYWMCPECGHHLIEHVQTGVTVVTDVYVVGGGSDVEFEDQTNQDGDEDWFQCRNCGQKICDGGREELLEHLGLATSDHCTDDGTAVDKPHVVANKEIINVFFEKGGTAEKVAQFTDEETYMACLPALEALAKQQGWDDVTESVEN